MGEEIEHELVENRFFKIIKIIFIIPILVLFSIFFYLLLTKQITIFSLCLICSLIILLSIPIMIPMLYYDEIKKYKKMMKRKLDVREIRSNNFVGTLYLLLWAITMPCAIISFFFVKPIDLVVFIPTFVFLSIFCFEMGYLKLNTAKKLKLLRRCEINGWEGWV